MRSSNPVLGRMFDDNKSSRQRSGSGGSAYGTTTYAPPPPITTAGSGYGTPGYGGPGYGAPGYGGPGYGGPGYGGPVQDLRDTDRMTIDDVVVRTAALVAVVIITAALSWNLLKTDNGWTTLAMVGASIGGIVLVFVISFRRIVNPWLIALYSILQGVLLGVVSREFERAYPGVVVQAVAATMAVFLGMAILYKFRVIRATPRFARWVIGALIGVVG